jgi:hypothetical protein
MGMGALLDILLVAAGGYAIYQAFGIYRTKQYRTKTRSGEYVVEGRKAMNYAIAYTVMGILAIAIGAYGLSTAL